MDNNPQNYEQVDSPQQVYDQGNQVPESGHSESQYAAVEQHQEQVQVQDHQQYQEQQQVDAQQFQPEASNQEQQQASYPAQDPQYQQQPQYEAQYVQQPPQQQPQYQPQPDQYQQGNQAQYVQTPQSQDQAQYVQQPPQQQYQAQPQYQPQPEAQPQYQPQPQAQQQIQYQPQPQQQPSFAQNAVVPEAPAGQNIPAMPNFDSLMSQQVQTNSDTAFKAPAAQDITIAKASATMTGVKSNDPSLTTNNAIVNFITSHASPPRVYVHQEAWHYETRTRTYTDSNGHLRTETYTQRVTDLNMYTEISQYVTPFYTLYDMDNIDKYLVSTNKLKKITVKKMLTNPLDSLCRAVYAINAMKFQHYHVRITLDNHEIKVFPDTKLSNCLRSRITDVLCILTCACIIFYPVKWCYEKNHICRMVFEMNANDAQIFAENYHKLWVWGRGWGVGIGLGGLTIGL